VRLGFRFASEEAGAGAGAGDGDGETVDKTVNGELTAQNYLGRWKPTTWLQSRTIEAGGSRQVG